MDDGYSTIEVTATESGGLLTVTLAGGKGNVLTMAMMRELVEALDEHRGDRDLHMVLLRSVGPHFSYGASVEEHQKDSAPLLLEVFHGLIRQIVRYPIPIAAAVRGKCFGGAFEVVLACHLVFATEDAVFACPEIKLGVFPPVLAAIGAQRIGGAAMERLLLTGGELSALQGLQIGWLTELVAADRQLDEAALAWYRSRLAPLSARSLRVATRVAREAGGLLDAVYRPLDLAEKTYVEDLLETYDADEGIRAFLEKRRPRWRNE